MNKFDELYNKIIFEEIQKLPTTDTILSKNLCNPNNCYRWVKGQANVYACLITNKNFEQAIEFLKKDRENSNVKPQVGKYLIYNPHIKEQDGQVWMNKLAGYSKTTPDNSAFDNLHISKDGLEFDEYIFIPKNKDLEEGVDLGGRRQIKKRMTFKINKGCGNNGADESIAYETDWLPIVNGKFDWARSLPSMKQSNFKCIGKEQPKINNDCLNSWNTQNE